MDQAARDAQVSGNVWAMRCIERCVSGDAADMVQAVFPEPLRKVVDDWRDKNGISTRAEAIRRLVLLGLGRAEGLSWTEGIDWMMHDGPGNQTALDAQTAAAGKPPQR